MALSDIRQGQETLVKTPQTLIAGLLPAATELHRGTDTVALGLTFMQQDHPWKRRDREHGRFLLVIAEACCGARLVVIFQKTYVGLEWGVWGAYAGSQPVDIACQQCIVKLFVVRELEAKLLQARLQTPVDLGHTAEIRKARPYCLQGLVPELAGRYWEVQSTPGPTKDIGEAQHCHVTAHPIAPLCQTQELVLHGIVQFQVTIVQLCRVAPGGEIGVFAMGDIAQALRSLHRE